MQGHTWNGYDEIQVEKVEVPIVGQVEVSEDEKSIMRRNPKFAVPDKIDVNVLQEELERSYSIMRMELREEEEMDEGQGRKEEKQCLSHTA